MKGKRRSEGCSPAFKRCSKLSAQYGPEGTPPLLTQTYHTLTRAHTRTQKGEYHIYRHYLNRRLSASVYILICLLQIGEVGGS